MKFEENKRTKESSYWLRVLHVQTIYLYYNHEVYCILHKSTNDNDIFFTIKTFTILITLKYTTKP